MAKAKERLKWEVTVWTDATSKRYEDAHEKHRAEGRECGTVRTVGRLFKREYDKRSSVNRALPHVRRRYPTGVIEVTLYKFHVFAWWQQGTREVYKPGEGALG